MLSDISVSRRYWILPFLTCNFNSFAAAKLIKKFELRKYFAKKIVFPRHFVRYFLHRSTKKRPFASKKHVHNYATASLPSRYHLPTLSLPSPYLLYTLSILSHFSRASNYSHIKSRQREFCLLLLTNNQLLHLTLAGKPPCVCVDYQSPKCFELIKTCATSNITAARAPKRLEENRFIYNQ